ncbi:MAG: sigma-70 family RNA polymerase sigma factor [Verrucomicrobiales bacterium]|nr:sigma-70 family RNA polymerase sigma factor [Verrucomicrobiales bacterium]
MTRIMNAVQLGDPGAAGELLPLVYEQLRHMAAARMQREAPGHTLQPTALVHEVWLRLTGGGQHGWENRTHFFAAAGEAMRRILVDHARRKRSQKRGGAAIHEALDEDALALTVEPEELLAVHEALDELAVNDPQAAQLVKCRYFIGMTMEEASTALGMSKRSAEGLWTYARAWLQRSIRERAG